MFKKLLPLAVATFAVSTDSLVIAGLLPEIAKSLEVSLSAAGQLVTAFALTYAIAAPVLGAATSALDRRTVLLIAMGVFVVGNVLAAVGETYAVVLTARIICALAAALVSSIAMATASALAPPEKRGRALALVTAGMTLATTAGVPLGTLIGGTDWRITMWSVAALAVVAGVGILVGLPRVTLPSAVLADRLRPLRDPGVLAILAVTLVILTSGYVLYTYIGAAVRPVTGGETVGLTVVLVAYGLGSIVGNVVSGFLTDRFAPVRVLLAGLVVLVTTLALTPLVTMSMASTLVWAVVWGASGWLTGLPQQHRLVTRAPEASAVLLGLNVSVLQLGIAVGGGIGGLILQWGSVVWLGIVSAAIAAVALLVTIATTRTRTPSTSEAVVAAPAPAP
ncbi:MFS transporter [Stackebrandtia soli]|uniref:MFS transporter n=1 Tax=Stackebrandtia soli TaxID=1892856 RepID=UPI0039E86BAB